MRVLLATTLFLSLLGPADAADGCKHTVVGRQVSPGQAWQAVVDETICDAGPYSSDITATVRVGRVSSSAAIAVLGVDTGGHAEDRPRLTWSGANILDVTVPNLSFLKVLQLRPGDVRVHLLFSPNDPAARKAWLSQHNLSPD